MQHPIFLPVGSGDGNITGYINFDEWLSTFSDAFSNKTAADIPRIDTLVHIVQNK
jgi:hypothetical protein